MIKRKIKGNAGNKKNTKNIYIKFNVFTINLSLLLNYILIIKI